jgi:hypothetical protein
MHMVNGETPAADPARLIRRLCKHWSHKYPVQFDDTKGVIELPAARVTLRAVAANRLAVTLENADAEVPPRLLGVVAEHLQRMAGEETLALQWSEPVTT